MMGKGDTAVNTEFQMNLFGDVIETMLVGII